MEKNALLQSCTLLLCLNLNSSELKTAQTEEYLPFDFDSRNSQIYSCFETRSRKLKATTCEQISKSCLDDLAFVPGTIRTPVAPNIYDLITYTKDKAENVSKKQCQTSVVSSAAPAISVKWEKQEWNIRIQRNGRVWLHGRGLPEKMVLSKGLSPH